MRSWLWRNGETRLGPSACCPLEGETSTQDLVIAMYGHLALTPAQLIGVALVDAVGDRRTQNIPGTSDEYPNWRDSAMRRRGQASADRGSASCELVRAVVDAATAPGH